MTSFHLCLPKTSFAMRGNLPQQEPLWLDFWSTHSIDEKRRIQNQKNPLFVLQDGPPYANGPIHMGHALNKVLKDVVQRQEFFRGHDVSFVPGWDCHGLPIENHVEKELLKEKKTRKDLTTEDFRHRCRQSAHHWIQEQKKGFQRLGVSAPWNTPYATMDFSFEAGVVDRLFQMVKKGYIYQGFRPVLWSAAEQTALAEAEVEYQDVVSPSLYVRFPVVKSSLEALQGASVVIWTTTPWSLPGNQGVAYGEDIVYGLYEVMEVQENTLGRPGEKILVAKDLAPEVFKEAGIMTATLIQDYHGRDLWGTMVAHPLWVEGFPKEVPLIPSEFVTTSAGTGLVHTAPAHGMEDFIVAQRHGLPLYNPLSSQGIFLSDVPLVGGMFMDKVFKDVLKSALTNHGALLAQRDYSHSYPHSWRSKKPLFYFLAKQWFLALDGPLNLRQRALNVLPSVKWHPNNAYRRMEATLKSRPDWCISRQRLWGIPLAFFVNNEGDILQDDTLFQNIVERIGREGCDFWFNGGAAELLLPQYSPDVWRPVQDIVDVWVESGLVSSLILDPAFNPSGEKNHSGENSRTQWPADLYIEGSDQHRAWFQSSLTLSMAIHDAPPYKEVLTHGFILDEKGQKMSKSLGNVLDPMDIINKKGADILRLWVVYSDYQKDMLVGNTILSRVEDLYRRFRNTLRYLLGSLDNWHPQKRREVSGLLEKWILHRLYTLEQSLNHFYSHYDFRSMIHHLHSFCNEDLSAFYFHSLKDTLYCDNPSEAHGEEIRRVLYEVFIFLTHWLGSFLPFTTEEAWQCLKKDILQDSLEGLGYEFSLEPWCLHLNEAPKAKKNWEDPQTENLVAQWMIFKNAVCALREKKREDIPDLLQAHVKVYFSSEKTPLVSGNFSIFHHEKAKDLAEAICGLSTITLVEMAPEEIKNIAEFHDDVHNFGLTLEKNSGEKCQRCWKVKEDVAMWRDALLCGRCVHVEEFMEKP